MFTMSSRRAPQTLKNGLPAHTSAPASVNSAARATMSASAHAPLYFKVCVSSTR